MCVIFERHNRIIAHRVMVKTVQDYWSFIPNQIVDYAVIEVPISKKYTKWLLQVTA